MALSRIWAAFIIIAVLVASFRWGFGGDKQIFSRMVTGKADDAFDSVAYIMIGSPAKAGFDSRNTFNKITSDIYTPMVCYRARSLLATIISALS